ncbi:MAG: CopG family transcriptional regulator [Bythopirellula sp.]|nr:CopG family transcriptional regulator [Bythopirellula sp.]
MNIQLTPDASQFVEGLVATGQYPSVDQAVDDGVKLLMARNRMKQDIQEAFDDVKTGRVMSHDDFFTDLKAYAKQLDEKSGRS